MVSPLLSVSIGGVTWQGTVGRCSRSSERWKGKADEEGR